MEVKYVPVSYKKLWKLLIDKDMKKKDLCKAAGISSSSIVKLSKNENVTTGVLVKICKALNCDIGDIMEIVDDLVDDAIAYSKPGMVDNNNLQTIAQTLSAASNSVSLREAYDSIFDRLPLCQRIIRHKKYLPLFLCIHSY